MNKISLHNVGKKFNRDWIFKNISVDLHSGDRIAVTGYNGSGKSTLLQIIAGFVSFSEGELNYLVNDKKVERENVFGHLSFASPYYEFIDEFTLCELFSFCLRFKKAIGNKSVKELIEIAELPHAHEKPLKFFSSGMKQRAKLTLALYVDAPFVFLDEPISNLDKNAVNWFQNILSATATDKIILICSNNIEAETSGCNKILCMEDYLMNSK